MTKITSNILTVHDLFTDTARIEREFVKIKTAGRLLQDRMHKVACSVLAHLEMHGDIRMVRKMLEAMPDMSRKNGLIKWFEAFGKVMINPEAKGVEQVIFNPDGKTMLAEALGKPFWKFKSMEGAPAFDMIGALENLIKRLDKAGSDPEARRVLADLLASRKAALEAAIDAPAPDTEETEPVDPLSLLDTKVEAIIAAGAA